MLLLLKIYTYVHVYIGGYMRECATSLMIYIVASRIYSSY